VGLAEQGLADDGGALAQLASLDRGAQPSAARADHHHVVVVPLDLGHRYRVLVS
jgi:hypothetical protein